LTLRPNSIIFKLINDPPASLAPARLAKARVGRLVVVPQLRGSGDRPEKFYQVLRKLN
jgi:hypothetical protein